LGALVQLTELPDVSAAQVSRPVPARGLTRPDPVTALPSPQRPPASTFPSENPDKPQNTSAAGQPRPETIKIVYLPASTSKRATEFTRWIEAKAYRLLKAIFNTAVDDGMIRRNPCRIKGASVEKSPERPVLTSSQVFALAELIDQRYSALVLLGTFGSLRWGELAALRRKDIDLAAGTVRVERQLTELPGGGYRYGPPKSEASQRTIPIPNLIVPSLRSHLDTFTGRDDDASVFTSPTGLPLRHGNFRRRVWVPALKAARLPMIHFHDLRHAGNTFTADAGANLRELMERMGHSTTKAALVVHGRSA
jgi:integrase